ncbi:MAG: SPOR domain-containing protein, partial [Methylobacter sp.]|nr:SPOR domain-containing protein [Methylobacter sp.]
PKAHPQAVVEKPLPAAASVSHPHPVDETGKNTAPKAQAKDAHVETAAKVKKAVEPVKPITVKKPENEPSITAAKAGSLGEAPRQTTPKQLGDAKSLAAAVAEAKKPEAAPKANTKLVRWYIQLGSFSKKENAMSLWDSLREQGVPASLDTVETDKGTAYRLRVGPELDGKKAAAMKLRLDKQNIKAILISE